MFESRKYDKKKANHTQYTTIYQKQISICQKKRNLSQKEEQQCHQGQIIHKRLSPKALSGLISN